MSWFTRIFKRPVSAQRRAMYAAAAGHWTLGIPKEVGEFTSKHKPGKLPARNRRRASRAVAIRKV